MNLLRDLVAIAAVGVVVSVLLGRLRFPVTSGLLVAGALVGPHGLGLVRSVHEIESLAEVGVVFLLFTIGLEFSLARLGHIWRLVFAGGALQVGLTTLAVVAALAALGMPPQRAVLLGFAVALSSTAIVLRSLDERGETDTPHGRLIVGALIFQDLCVVPMMLLVPVLAGKRAGQSPLAAGAFALGKAAAVVATTLVVARRLVPRVFALVDRTRSREVFLLAVLVVCVGTAWLTSLAGLSLALGAFLAGVVLADSDYAHRAMGDVLPLRDALASFFFMSLGMLLEPAVLVRSPARVGAIFLAMVLGKAALATASGLAMRVPLRVALLAGVGLAQFGEFGFVLATAGTAVELIKPAESQQLLAAALLTMLVAPLAIRAAPRALSAAGRVRGLARVLGTGADAAVAPGEAAPADHVVLVGYGVAGGVLARALRGRGVRYVVLEINAATVRSARRAGEPIFYGDVAGPEALAHANVRAARALVLLINDPAAAERAIAAARRHAPDVPVLVRTRYLRDAPRLTALGATEVVVDEVESAVEVLARALHRVGATSEEVEAQRALSRERAGRDASGPVGPTSG